MRPCESHGHHREHSHGSHHGEGRHREGSHGSHHGECPHRGRSRSHSGERRGALVPVAGPQNCPNLAREGFRGCGGPCGHQGHGCFGVQGNWGFGGHHGGHEGYWRFRGHHGPHHGHHGHHGPHHGRPGHCHS